MKSFKSWIAESEVDRLADGGLTGYQRMGIKLSETLRRKNEAKNI
jgi:hypothetical protein